ncbi:MAG: 2-amino-4-hydroxy-6-hydroxymethyldihydropteridine diphosphokinase [Candidatus Theseobacter exili]|nr:2-amino-4-hydroxy-6-hydroxymethyldihydropteridine diphosphokinase [Candidatus Theseobacter exili]
MKNVMVDAYIGLGSNLGDRHDNLKNAVRRIENTRKVNLKALSSIYESRPEGGKAGPDFLNAVAAIETDLSIEELLENTELIEKSMGRVAKGTGANRTIDLDLLIYGDIEYSSTNLVIPHPKISKRLFVLEPLSELVPLLEVPGTGKKVSCLLKELSNQSDSVKKCKTLYY